MVVSEDSPSGTPVSVLVVLLNDIEIHLPDELRASLMVSEIRKKICAL
jgi:hypothetical protein